MRPFNAYGPAQSPDRIIPEIIVKALRKERLAMTQGRQTREFNYVEDLVDGFLRAATVPGIEGEVFNIGGGEEISMRDLAQTILGLMGNPIEAEFGALPERPTEIWSMRSDVTKAREPTRSAAVPARCGRDLEQTISWYRQELEQSGARCFPIEGGYALVMGALGVGTSESEGNTDTDR